MYLSTSPANVSVAFLSLAVACFTRCHWHPQRPEGRPFKDTNGEATKESEDKAMVIHPAARFVFLFAPAIGLGASLLKTELLPSKAELPRWSLLLQWTGPTLWVRLFCSIWL